MSKPLWELPNLLNNPEHALYDSITTEFNHIAGFPVYYYVLESTDESDSIYGELPNATFSEPYRTKVVYEPTEENNIIDVFGIMSDDLIEFMSMTKTMFKRDVSSEFNPKIGDCIKTLWNNKMYEITNVESAQKIFHGMKMGWDFMCRPYVHSEQSQSAEDMINEVLTDADFPDINTTTITQELSAYGDNDDIDIESDTIEDYDGVNTNDYGYNDL